MPACKDMVACMAQAAEPAASFAHAVETLMDGLCVEGTLLLLKEVVRPDQQQLPLLSLRSPQLDLLAPELVDGNHTLSPVSATMSEPAVNVVALLVVGNGHESLLSQQGRLAVLARLQGSLQRSLHREHLYPLANFLRLSSLCVFAANVAACDPSGAARLAILERAIELLVDEALLAAVDGSLDSLSDVSVLSDGDGALEKMEELLL
jgi:hypothetical protein